MSSDWKMSENDKKIEDTISKILVSSAKPGAITNIVRPNCVDKFNQIHQDEHEACVRADHTGLIQRVNHHNSACPKMYDELEKRRSIMQITTIKAERFRYFHPDCAACAKLITLRELTEQNVKPRCQKSRRSVRVKRCGTVKQKKPRAVARPRAPAPPPPPPSARRQPGLRLSRTISRMKNRGCQCISYIYVTNKQNGTSDDFYPEINTDRIKNERRPKRKLSVSSYNSDFSLGHEPMVSDYEV